MFVVARQSLIDDRNNLQCDWELRILLLSLMAEHIRACDWVKTVVLCCDIDFVSLAYSESLSIVNWSHEKKYYIAEKSNKRQVERSRGEEISLNEFVFNVEVEVE